jgi:hypothetical protein
MGQAHKKSIAAAGAEVIGIPSASARRSRACHANSDRELPSGKVASVVAGRMQQTSGLSRGGKPRSKDDRLGARVSFAVSDGFLLSAVFVLASARGLRKAGLIGPGGSLAAFRLSQYLVQTGMQIWRREWVMPRNRKW